MKIVPWPFSLGRMKALLGLGGDDDIPSSSLVSSGHVTVPSVEDAQRRLRTELARARRYERSLSILVVTVPVDPDGAPEWHREGDGSASGESPILLETRVPHLASLLVATILTGLVRESDRVTYVAPDDRFILALPETPPSEARKALRRLEEVVRVRSGSRPRGGIAGFPDDGVTLTELLETAEERWRAASVDLPWITADGDGTTAHD